MPLPVAFGSFERGKPRQRQACPSRRTRARATIPRKSARDRDRLRQDQLERQGWRFHRIWSSEWFYHKDACAAKAIAAYQEAIRIADDDKPPQPMQPRQPGTPQSTPPQQAAPQRTGERPLVPRGYPIGEYSDGQLTGLVQWIRSDGILRTEDELL